MKTPTSERTKQSLKPRFPRLQFARRRREAHLDVLQSNLEEMVAEHRRAGNGWFATADSDGMVQIRPAR